MYDPTLEKKWRTWVECCPSSKIVNVPPEPFANEMLFHRAVKRKCKELKVPYIIGEKYNRPHFSSGAVGTYSFSQRLDAEFGHSRTIDEAIAYIIYLNEGFWKIKAGKPVPSDVAANWCCFVDKLGELHIDIDEITMAAENGKLLQEGYLLLKNGDRFSKSKKQAGIGVYILTPKAYFQEISYDGQSSGYGVWYQSGDFYTELPRPDFNIVRSEYRNQASPYIRQKLDKMRPKWVCDRDPWIYNEEITKDTRWNYWVLQNPKKFDPILLHEFRRLFKEFSNLADNVHKEKRVYKGRLAYYQQFYQDPLLFEPDIIDWNLVKNEVLPNLQYDLAKFNLYVSRGL